MHHVPRNEFPGVTAYQPPELEKTIRGLNDGQMAVLDASIIMISSMRHRLQQELDDQDACGRVALES